MDFKVRITTGIKVDLFNEMYIHIFQGILEANSIAVWDTRRTKKDKC